MRISKPLPYVVLALCAILYFAPFLRVRAHDADEGALLQGAVRVLQGQLPSRDFVEFPGPGSFYWLALFFKLLGPTYLATRIDLLITTVLTALLLFYLARRLPGGHEAAPVIFFAAVSFHTWNGLSHHMESNVLCLLAFAAFVSWTDKLRPLTLFLAGLTAGLATWFMLQKGVLLLLSFVLLLWILYRKNPVFRLALSALLGGFVLVNAAVLGLFWAAGGLADLVNASLIRPLTSYSATGAVPYGWLLPLYWSVFLASLKPVCSTAVAAAWSSILSAPFVALVGLPLVLAGCAARFRRSAFDRATLPYWISGCALWISEMHRPDLAHLAWGSPILILLAFSLCRQIRGCWVKPALATLTFCAVLLALVNPLAALLANHKLTTRRGIMYDTFPRDQTLDFLNAHLAPGEPLFVYPYLPIYYFLSAATNPTRYSFLMYRLNTARQFREVVQTLETHKVRYVIWDRSFPRWAKEMLPAYRIPLPQDLIVEPYLTEHYRVVGVSEEGYEFLERNEPTPSAGR